MSDPGSKSEVGKSLTELRLVHSIDSAALPVRERHHRFVPFIVTLAVSILAGLLGWATWEAYMGAPWTRDGAVRTYVVTMAAEVAGRVVELRVADNEFVHKGDVLMVIDPTDYRIAVKLAEAALKQAEVSAENLQREAERRRNLVTTNAVSAEQEQTYVTNAIVAEAQHQQAIANRDQAQVNLERTQIRSPVNGWVTNLLVQLGDYATVGHNIISVVNADAFWVDAYFEETKVHVIRDGDPALVKVMGFSQVLRGHVGGVARGIDVPNAQPDLQGLATVNPIFTWVRLAQRVPVRIQLGELPSGLRLVAGMTATVEVETQAKDGSHR